ncbi:MAG TPA: nucleoside-diphosphate kinase [bacterium]|nr:nucleoside-diphosphate kinase [bacterium]
MEKSLVIVKPDGVQRGLIGEIISRFEKKGFKIIGLKMIHITPELAEKHYKDHIGKDFYASLVEFITCSPVVVLAIQGDNAVRLIRNMMGALKPEDAQPGSIRGDLALSKSYNVIHGSDSPENGEREVGLFFEPDELFDYERDIDTWLKT